MSEKRSARRWPTCLKGQVRAEDGRVLDCLIRDFSATGARLELSGATELPASFKLYFPLKQATFPAHVRWRRDNELGLSFETPIEAPVDPQQAVLLERLLELEADNASLRLELASYKAKQLAAHLQKKTGTDN
ncbi:MAG TPA: PilZ domain-containing protein [Beijerinckiaceae bacterium]|nr:PilZ domain-containing protein [Beijerinckiaceae bacterium]